MIKKIRSIACIYFTVLIFFSNTVYGLESPEVKISQPPGWTETISFDEGELKNKPGVRGGRYYLLVDEQTNAIKEKHEYKHYAVKLLNEKAVEDNSRITIDFSPEFQSLEIHKIIIWRNGTPISQPIKNNIKLLQREKELENLIYDGRWTATFLIEDVRKGDILEYSYTVKGQNPAYKKNIDEIVYFQWSVPVSRQVYRLLWPEKMPINITAENKIKNEINVSKKAGYMEYRIERADYPTTQIDSETPDWFDPYQRVSFSNISKWQEVINWGLEFYVVDPEVDVEIELLAKQLQANYKSKIEQASAALQYVQDEVRYLGIEVGSGSFIPSKANVTLKRRYGDCKDKTYLLLSILKSLNIEAYPVLANTQYGEDLNTDGPRLNAFNHVLVKTIIDGKWSWLETTTNNQAGTLDKLFQPDYGQVLVLKKGNKSLTTMSVDNTYHKVILNEEFDLTQGVNKEALYTINTIYSGNDAEKFRRDINSKGTQKISKEYLDYYIKYYDNISAVNDIEISDDKNINQISTVEKYKISNMWKDKKGKKKHYAYFYSNSIEPYLNKPKIRKRISPFKYSQLVNVEQNISVLLPSSWNIKDDYVEYKTPFFNFSQKTIYDDKERKLQLKYKLVTLKKYIMADDIAAYLKAVDKVNKDLDYSIYSSYAVNVNASKEDFLSHEFLGIVAVVVVLLLLIYSYLEFRFDQKKSPSDKNYKYYPASTSKVFILSLCTYGLYLVYWFYKNWHYVKIREQHSIIPWGRALFYSFWFYPLYKSFSRDDAFSDMAPSKYRNYRYAGLAIIFFVAGFIANSDHVISYLGIIITAACVLPLVEKINMLTLATDEYFKFNSRWRPRHFILASLFLCIALFDVASRVNLIPNDTMVKGESLWQRDIKNMYRLGVLTPEEKLIMFYSNASFSFKEDGNGLSDKGVFSYWRDENTGKIKTEIAKFDDISEIKNTSDDYDMHTIKIIRRDHSEFYVYTKNSKKLNFYKVLKKYLNNVKKN